MGQSAGAQSVSEHLVRPQSWGLFARAGMESGCFASETDEFTVADLRPSFEKLLSKANCSAVPDPVQCLVDLDAVALLQTDLARVAQDGLHTWAPTVDGVELPIAGVNLARQGKMAPGVPFLVGSVSEVRTGMHGRTVRIVARSSSSGVVVWWLEESAGRAWRGVSE